VERADEPKATRTALAATTGLWALLFGPFLFAGGLPVYRDQLLTYLPVRHFWAEQVRAGRLPAWFPWEGLGEPFLGQGITATFSPMNVLFLLFEDAAALRAEIALTLVLGALGQVLLTRRLQASAAAAVTSAMALMLSGYALSMTSNVNYLRGLCLLPWVALFAHAVLTAKRPWAPTAGLAFTWALIPLGGDAIATLLAGAVVGAVLVGVGPGRRWPWLFGAAALTVLLATPELLPSAAQRVGSVMAEFRNAEFLSSYWALHPAQLPELLLPGLTPLDALWATTPLGENGRWAESMFIGAAVLLLATSAPRTRLALSFLGLAALGLWLSLGAVGGLELWLRKLLPMLNTIRNPEKHFALVAFGLATAVALGVDQAVRAPRSLLPGAAFTTTAVVVSWLATSAPTAHVALLLAVGLLLVAGGLCVAAHRDARAVWLLPVLIVASSWKEPLGLMTMSVEDFAAQPTPPGTARVWRERGARGLPLDAEQLHALARAEHALLSGALGALHHRATFSGATTLPLEAQRERALLGWELSKTRALAPLFGFDVALLADGTDLPLPASPRAFVATPRGMPDFATLLRRLREAPAEAAVHPLVVGALPEPDDAPVGTVRWVRDEVTTLELAATLERKGLLVLNDLAADGWTVTVDGAPSPAYIVNALVRGVLLPPGEHTVVFRYEPPRLKLALGLAALALAVLAGLLALELRARRRDA